MKDKKVVIIGAGIVGLSTAYFLHKKGIEVTVIDNTDGTDNCSFGNAGYVSPSHLMPLASPGIISQGLRWMLNSESPFYIKPRLDRDLIRWGLLFKRASTESRANAGAEVLCDLAVQSQELYEQILADENIEAGYNKPGLLMICKTKEELQHEVAVVNKAKTFGLEAEELSQQELSKLEPDVEYDMAGAVYFGCDAWMTPHVFMKAFKERLVAAGIDIRFNTELKQIVKDGAKIDRIITSKGEMEADEFILTAGAWTPLLMKQLKVDLPLQAGKGYSIVLPNPPVMPKLPSILSEGKVATTPMLHGLRFAGTMELAGTQLNINPKRVNGIVNCVKEFMPQFRDVDFSNLEPWAGLRPCTPDGLPYIGRTKRYDNLLVGTGHAMLGWTLGPITGQLLAQEVTGDDLAVSSPLLEVERYA